MVTQSLSQKWKVNLTYEKPVHVIKYNKKKNHMISQKTPKKAFEKLQYSFLITTPGKAMIERNLLCFLDSDDCVMSIYTRQRFPFKCGQLSASGLFLKVK